MNLEDLFSPEEIADRRRALLERLLSFGQDPLPVSERALHIGHKLNGAGGTLGMTELAQEGRSLEHTARSGNVTDDILAGVMHKMQEELSRMCGDSATDVDVDPTSAEPQPASAAKVLCVDDTPESLVVLSALVKRLGVQVLQAKNGQEALDVVAASAPDVVLMDRMMPGMSGDDACARMREQGFDKPVLAVTAMACSVDDLDAPFSGLIAKPLNMAKAMQSMREALHEAGFDLDA